MRSERTAGGQRVTARIAGHDVWFESADAVLRPAPEAFASAFLPLALHLGAVLRVQTPLDGRWLANTRALASIFSEWWELPHRYPLRGKLRESDDLSEPRPEVGLCFTGGIDSFQSLLHGDHGVSRLVFAHGYDIPYSDRERMAHFEPTLREVGRATGSQAIVIRTNLREHPASKKVSWERSHGAALAALGHLLSDSIGELVIASSWRYRSVIPWGSSPRTDPLWSSHRLRVTHGDATFARLEKLLRIADEPLLWDHLRVCWENRTPTGNCSRCEKCLRTMVGLAACGQLKNYSVFDHHAPIAERLREMPMIPEHLTTVWRSLLQHDLEPSIQSAIEDRLP